jgi:hypothetical protein
MNCNPFMLMICDNGLPLPPRSTQIPIERAGSRTLTFFDRGAEIFIRYIAPCSIGIATLAQ